MMLDLVAATSVKGSAVLGGAGNGLVPVPGKYKTITTVIAEHDGNIDAVKMDRSNLDFTDMTVDLTVWDLKHLNAIISELRQKPVISAVERIIA